MNKVRAIKVKALRNISIGTLRKKGDIIAMELNLATRLAKRGFVEPLEKPKASKEQKGKEKAKEPTKPVKKDETPKETPKDETPPGEAVLDTSTLTRKDAAAYLEKLSGSKTPKNDNRAKVISRLIDELLISEGAIKKLGFDRYEIGEPNNE